MATNVSEDARIEALVLEGVGDEPMFFPFIRDRVPGLADVPESAFRCAVWRLIDQHKIELLNDFSVRRKRT